MATVAPGRDYSWLDNMIKQQQVIVQRRQNQIDAGVRTFMTAQKVMDPDKMASAMDEIEGVGFFSKMFGGGNKVAKLVNPYADKEAGKEIAIAAAFKEMEKQGGWMTDASRSAIAKDVGHQEALKSAMGDEGYEKFSQRGRFNPEGRVGGIGKTSLERDKGRYDKMDILAQQSDADLARQSYRVGDTYTGKGSDQLQGIMDNYKAGGSYDQYKKSALEWAHVYGVEPREAMLLATPRGEPGGKGGAKGDNFMALDRYGNPLYTHTGANADEARAAILKKYPHLKAEDLMMIPATAEGLKPFAMAKEKTIKQLQTALLKKKGLFGGIKQEDIIKARAEAAKYKYTVSDEGVFVPTGEEIYDRPGGGGELDDLTKQLLDGPAANSAPPAKKTEQPLTLKQQRDRERRDAALKGVDENYRDAAGFGYDVTNTLKRFGVKIKETKKGMITVR